MPKFSAEVILDSLAPCGKRLTTMVVTYPRIVHPELLTHRMLSRNSASSRAIPIKKMIEMVVTEPVIPVHWGKNQPGMKAEEELTIEDQAMALTIWLAARDDAVRHARALSDLGVHKQIVNRLIEPFAWITVIISATEWDNFFGLRCHKDAQPEIQKIARLMLRAFKASQPVHREWHTPFILSDEEYLEIGQKIKISAARAARVSYLTHFGSRDINKDIDLHDKLLVSQPLHASPAEHVAQALEKAERVGNFIGWKQYRKTLPNECITDYLPTCTDNEPVL